MKAVVMAGGQGTRGRPYTEYFPKAMTPISDKPLIDHIIQYLRSFEFVDGVIVVSDYGGLGGQILNYYGGAVCADDMLGSAAKDVVFVQDSQSGTGGDLLHASELIPKDEPFILWFVDNLCAIDLDAMRSQFEKNNSAACIATRTERAEATGFAVVSDGGTVRKFVEKPVMQLSSSECLGVYMLDYGILGRISDVMKARVTASHTIQSKPGARGADSAHSGTSGMCGAQVNLSHDILEGLSAEGSVSAFDIGSSQWVDIESPAILERNKARICNILCAMRSFSG